MALYIVDAKVYLKINYCIVVLTLLAYNVLCLLNKGNRRLHKVPSQQPTLDQEAEGRSPCNILLGGG